MHVFLADVWLLVCRSVHFHVTVGVALAREMLLHDRPVWAFSHRLRIVMTVDRN